MVTAVLFTACLLLQAETSPPLLVLSAAGTTRDSLPVAEAHPLPKPYVRVLTRGYSARLLRLYQLEQRLTRPNRPPQPGVLLLTDQQGGFPRWGLHLDSPQPELAYVDLHRRSVLSGRPGAIDQIFPHELLHIIVRDLAGEPPEGQATQVHAVGVRTDRITAFNEGFAEHGQIMAIDDADAVMETRAIASDAAMRTEAFRQFDAYRAALGARLHIAPKAQMTFPLWFSRAEQVLRYHAVKANLFARRADVPRHLYSERRAHDAYLLEHTLPGLPDAPPKKTPQLLATEGVVANLFQRIVTDASIQRVYRDPAFYAQFDAVPSAVDALDNAYLKVFVAIREGKYDAAAVLDAYRRLFPDERAAVDRIVADVFLGQPIEAPPELWLRNDAATIGTSLFDQFRAVPRTPAFDLNAASAADLVAVPGVDLALAERIIRAGPFTSIDELARVEDVTAATVDRFRAMREGMNRPAALGVAAEGLSIRRVLMPYVWRALMVWTVCALAGAALYGAVRRLAWWRLGLNGLAAAGIALMAGWIVDSGTGWIALVAPLALFALPGSIVRGARTRSLREMGSVIVAWAAAALAAVIAVTPIGP